jgi:hypothetical protein
MNGQFQGFAHGYRMSVTLVQQRFPERRERDVTIPRGIIEGPRHMKWSLESRPRLGKRTGSQKAERGAMSLLTPLYPGRHD